MNTENHVAPQFHIVRVAGSGPEALLVGFADGKSFKVNFREAIGRHKVLGPVLHSGIFDRGRIADMGRSLRWPGSEDYEIASDQLRAWGIDQAGGFSHARFIEWMWRHEHTLTSAAEALGLSRRMVAYYRDGSKEIPRTVALACRGWESLQTA